MYSAVIYLTPKGKFCEASSLVFDRFYTFWIPLLVFECVLCALAIAKGVNEFRHNQAMLRRRRSLLAILVRDSVIYFVM